MPGEDETPVCKESVREIVREIVREHGVGFIPDGIEEKIYTNVATMLMRILDGVLSETRLTFMGHEIRLDLSPAARRECGDPAGEGGGPA